MIVYSYNIEKHPVQFHLPRNVSPAQWLLSTRFACLHDNVHVHESDHHVHARIATSCNPLLRSHFDHEYDVLCHNDFYYYDAHDAF